MAITRSALLWIFVACLYPPLSALAEGETLLQQPPEEACPNSSLVELKKCIQERKPKLKPVDPCPGLIEQLEQSFVREEFVRQEDLEFRRDDSISAEMKQIIGEMTETKVQGIKNLRRVLIEDAEYYRCKVPDLMSLKAKAIREKSSATFHGIGS